MNLNQAAQIHASTGASPAPLSPVFGRIADLSNAISSAHSEIELLASNLSTILDRNTTVGAGQIKTADTRPSEPSEMEEMICNLIESVGSLNRKFSDLRNGLRL